MILEECKIEDFEINEFNTLIIGTGAAGLNCALHLVEEGIEPAKIAIITEKLGGGTSFNTGSDKQTYYKLSIMGEQADSPIEMAKTYVSGGAMHGDIALIEASNSVREFFHLVQLGVPFPHDRYGGFVGYKTDNDPRQRATSIGPLTSQEMGKRLLKEVQNQDIYIIDNNYAFNILIDMNKPRSEAIGVISLQIDNLSTEKNLDNLIDSIKLYKSRNIIVATGGPAALYKYSVYPTSQIGSHGLAIKAGCKLQNLTESQFGLASTKFRWNVSGSYMQVIPRFISVDQYGKEYEFLMNYFPTFRELSKATFLKGYQWPFNADRIENLGSSVVDLAVYYETEFLSRRVYLDFTRNPSEYDENSLDIIAKEYLMNSEALSNTPIERLKKLNPKAIKLYKNNDVDITIEPLEIAVCNQHMNGGISGDIWWETNIKYLFAIGEVNGSHGVHRPGGAALNSGQVGGLRAAQKIGSVYTEENQVEKEIFLKIAETELKMIVKNFKSVLLKKKIFTIDQLNPSQVWEQIWDRMSKFGGIIRPLKNLLEEGKNIIQQLYNLSTTLILESNRDVIDYLRIKDTLLTQQYIIESILNYHKSSGQSRGSYLILRDKLNQAYNEEYVIPPGKLEQFKFIKSDINLKNKIQTIKSEAGIINLKWEDVREIPSDLGWFEHVWRDYLDGEVFR